MNPSNMDFCSPLKEFCNQSSEYIIVMPQDNVGACKWHLPLIIDEARKETGEKKIVVMLKEDYLKMVYEK